MDRTEKVFVTFNLAVKGVFGRNRTVKFKSHRLAEVEKGGIEPTAEELSQLVADRLAAIKAKPGLQWFLSKQEETETNYGDGMKSRSFMVFQDVKLDKGVVA